ncbi:hypothetical protein CJP74_06495 [Psittacicella melopsittaci]|uniref:LUD domain-containing protein n=1 Tax=Psittacicella melopsittaci TaxID=2028576 RepID=A0A3A1Y397_9GAMM|nr:lactate utilization protein C [Psittacicella melopsittaci]RIY31716.1 hypothetical protein CJP74_06495 [Psittacicella melopsittaci]
MDKNNRDEFLKSIALKYGREVKTAPDPIPEWVVNYPRTRLTDLPRNQLLSNYIDYCKTVGIDIQITTPENLARTMVELTSSYTEGKIILNDDQRLHQAGITQALIKQFGEDEIWVWDGKKGRANLAFAATANIGIVHAECGLTESGSIVLESSPNYGRSVSLLPKYTIVVLKSSTVLPRMHQYAVELDKRALKGERAPSVINVISGPSSTADIELIKVVGVHGPVGITYVIVDDEGSCADFTHA